MEREDEEPDGEGQHLERREHPVGRGRGGGWIHLEVDHPEPDASAPDQVPERRAAEREVAGGGGQERKVESRAPAPQPTQEETDGAAVGGDEVGERQHHEEPDRVLLREERQAVRHNGSRTGQEGPGSTRGGALPEERE